MPRRPWRPPPATGRRPPNCGPAPAIRPSPRPRTVRLSTYTANARYARSLGAHFIRAGADMQRFPVHERFAMALTSTRRSTQPGSHGYNEALLPYDLTRGGDVLPASRIGATGHRASAFVHSTLALGAVDRWRGPLRRVPLPGSTAGSCSRASASRTRCPGRDLVFRASYNRNYQTPPNENLLLSNSEAASELAPASVREALGGAYRPIQPERQDVYEVGATVRGRPAGWQRSTARPTASARTISRTTTTSSTRNDLPHHASAVDVGRRRARDRAATGTTASRAR